MQKNVSAGRGRSERIVLLAAAAVVAAYVLPLFLLGENAHIRVHDNLDSNIAWYRMLVRSGEWFGAVDATIPQVIGGLPRGAFGTEFSLLVALHAAFPPMLAYAISQAIVRAFAFLGMYLLLRDHFVKKADETWIRVGVALVFAMTPFWPSGMLSTLGQPLALWAFLHLRAGTARKRHWATIAALPLYSSFVLGFFFFLAGMFLFWAWEAIVRRRWNGRLLAGLALMTLIYLGIEYRLVLSLVLSDAPTSRDEFVSSKLPLWRSVRLAFKNFVLGHNHVQTLHTVVVLPMTWIASMLAASDRSWREGTAGRWLLPLLALSAALSIWYAFWFHEAWQPLKERFGLLNTFNFARFHFLRPLVIYVAFALACSLFWNRGGRKGRTLVVAGLLLQTVILLFANEEVVYRDKPSFREFYAERQFAAIAAYIGEPQSGYRVGSVGLHPAIAQFNGFYTVDTYNNFYPLAYKHAFRDIIAKELEKNRKLRTYFDTWGGRCYLFVDELGKKYDYRKTSKKTIRRLEFDIAAFRRLGGRYLFSAVPIANAEAIGLRRLRTFDDEDSAWKIHLYEAVPE
ncbi:DUF6044 family protein [Paenibacillus sp.]|uniref:DUF6044 family protein n=1 Tax=Paenibacillus sp. TaxID=58172 RepID=UPI002D7590BB|nr:DUF6044 family protein [Paenibacillus sp.]HZG56992.1 DUF6044 family protein [Paenibacillus sp.]